MNKKILVVGAAGLLGSSLVARLITNDVPVVATDIDLDALESKLQSLDLELSKNNQLVCEPLDLSDGQAIDNILEKHNDLSGAVNCSYPRAASYGRDFFDVTLESFNEKISLHLGTAFLFSQRCARFFTNQKNPFSLVNVASIYGVTAPKFEIYDNTSMTMPVEYAAIKSAIIHLNRYVAKYIKNSEFRINSISPGGILDKQPERFLHKYQSMTLGKGMLDADDVLGAISFLLSEDSKYINGQNLIIDDGFSL